MVVVADNCVNKTIEHQEVGIIEASRHWINTVVSYSEKKSNSKRLLGQPPMVTVCDSFSPKDFSDFISDFSDFISLILFLFQYVFSPFSNTKSW